MEPITSVESMKNTDREITATVLRERLRLGRFIRRQVSDQTDAEDILQDVFHEFVDAYRLPASIEHVSAWLFRVARHRIIDRFRKKKEQPLADIEHHADAEGDDLDSALHLDLALPSADDGPEAAYARSVLLRALQEAIEALPDAQRTVFVSHELDGISFKEMSASTGVGINTLLARKRYAVMSLRTSLQSVYEELND